MTQKSTFPFFPHVARNIRKSRDLLYLFSASFSLSLSLLFPSFTLFRTFRIFAIQSFPKFRRNFLHPFEILAFLSRSRTRGSGSGVDTDIFFPRSRQRSGARSDARLPFVEGKEGRKERKKRTVSFRRLPNTPKKIFLISFVLSGRSRCISAARPNYSTKNARGANRGGG